MNTIKLSEYRIGIKFDKDLLEQNSCFTKILNVYILHDLDTWPRNPITNFKFKNCLFGATTIVKNAFSGYEITFDSAGFRSFENYFGRTFVIIMFAIIKILFIMIIIIFLLMEKKSNN